MAQMVSLSQACPKDVGTSAARLTLRPVGPLFLTQLLGVDPPEPQHPSLLSVASPTLAPKRTNAAWLPFRLDRQAGEEPLQTARSEVTTKVWLMS